MTAFTPRELAVMFAKIEHELAAVGDRTEVLERLIELAASTVPGAQQAGVTTGRNGKFTTAAATDDIVLQIDEVQYRLGSGPCIDAVDEDAVFNAGDLRTDDRWPEFGQEAYRQTGIVSMLSSRLFVEHDEDLVAALNLYSAEPNAFDEASETVGALLATHGALAVSNAAAREKAANLLIALKTSREIGIAMGVLMHNHKITRDQAFDLLRMTSQRTHRKLALVAGEVADTGQLPSWPTRQR